MNKEWPIWEVFVRSKQGLDHKHCGSLHAPDAPAALRMARDVYTRRQEGVSIWVVPSSAITASNPADKAEFSEPPATKSIGIRRSSSCPTKSTTCERHDDHA